MIKDVVLSLVHVTGIDEEGKEIRKARRFNQVRIDMSDADLNTFKNLMASLTGETYVAADRIETKAVTA